VLIANHLLSEPKITLLIKNLIAPNGPRLNSLIRAQPPKHVRASDTTPDWLSTKNSKSHNSKVQISGLSCFDIESNAPIPPDLSHVSGKSALDFLLGQYNYRPHTAVKKINKGCTLQSDARKSFHTTSITDRDHVCLELGFRSSYCCRYEAIACRPAMPCLTTE